MGWGLCVRALSGQTPCPGQQTCGTILEKSGIEDSHDHFVDIFVERFI